MSHLLQMQAQALLQTAFDRPQPLVLQQLPGALLLASLWGSSPAAC